MSHFACSSTQTSKEAFAAWLTSNSALIFHPPNPYCPAPEAALLSVDPFISSRSFGGGVWSIAICLSLSLSLSTELYSAASCRFSYCLTTPFVCSRCLFLEAKLVEYRLHCAVVAEGVSARARLVDPFPTGFCDLTLPLISPFFGLTAPPRPRTAPHRPHLSVSVSVSACLSPSIAEFL